MSSLDATLGILQIAGHLIFLLFGALTIQTFVYYRSFPSDVRLCKILVAVVWIAECVHTILYAFALYDMSVTSFGDSTELSTLSNRAWSWAVLLGGIVTGLVQSFFALRLYHLMQQGYYAIVCWFLAFLSFTSTLAVMILCNANISITGFTLKWYWLIATTLGLYAVTDVAIAAGLCWSFWNVRSNSVSRTVRLVDHLLVWSLSTGVVTSIVATLAVIFVFTMTNNYVYFAVDCVLYKVYSNSLLASFNSRLSIDYQNGIRHVQGQPGSHGPALFSTLDSPEWSATTGEAMVSQPDYRLQ